MKLRYMAVAAPLLLAGCAQNAADIHAAYVSPVTYQAMTCPQLGAEASRVSAAAAAATGAQNSKATNDAVMTGVSVVLFWPALFFVHGDQGNAANLANLKGQMQAIEEANTAKNCGIVFQAS
jgi:hypothetical protein